MAQVLFGIEDENLVADLTSILEVMDDYTVRAVAKTPADLIDLTGRLEPEIVFVHEALGIEPIEQIIRDVLNRRPATAVLQVSHTRTPASVIKAMESGARGVIAYPFAYEDVSSRIVAAAEWASNMKAVLAGAAAQGSTRGEVIAVVGAKGGVGTTTIASHIAFDHLRNNPEAKVCLIDVDIEKGDVGAIFEVRQSVSVADVAKVSGDLSPHAVRDAVVEHESGIHLLLAPLDVREGEFVTPEALRSIVSLLRREFDLVVLDGGGHVSPAQAAVIELASECLVVTTPDVLSVRAMRRRMIAWEALGVHEEAGFKVLVNKVDRGSLFPESSVSKLTTAHVVQTKIPLSPRVLEASVNDRNPGAVTEVAWWSLINSLRVELGLAEPKTKGAKQVDWRRKKKKRGDELTEEANRAEAREPVSAGNREAGGIGLENAGVFPIALALCLLCWQIAVTGFSVIYAGHASAAAAREYAISSNRGDSQRAAERAVPSTLRSGLNVRVSHGSDEVAVTVPVVKGMPLVDSVTSTRGVVSER